MVKALAYDTRSRQLVIVKNDGAVKNLPDDAMVEIPAYITKDGPEPVRVGEIPRFYKGLIEQQDACEGLVVEAVIEGSYKKALQAFTLNRTIPSANVAKEILDEIKTKGTSKERMRKAGQYCVQIYGDFFGKLNGAGMLQLVSEDIQDFYELVSMDQYSEDYGLDYAMDNGIAIFV